MKFFSILITAIYLILNSCSNSTKPDTEEGGYPPKDSLKINAIDTFMWKIDKLWKPDSTFHLVAFNERDTLKYIEVDGNMPRISSVFITDTTIIWVVFHLDNGELKLVRYREKRDKPVASVKEAISYFEKGKIFYSKERGRGLEPGEGAGSFRTLPFTENTRTPAELEAEYGPFWEASKKAIAEYKAKNQQ